MQPKEIEDYIKGLDLSELLIAKRCLHERLVNSSQTYLERLFHGLHYKKGYIAIMYMNNLYDGTKPFGRYLEKIENDPNTHIGKKCADAYIRRLIDKAWHKQNAPLWAMLGITFSDDTHPPTAKKFFVLLRKVFPR